MVHREMVPLVALSRGGVAACSGAVGQGLNRVTLTVRRSAGGRRTASALLVLSAGAALASTSACGRDRQPPARAGGAAAVQRQRAPAPPGSRLDSLRSDSLRAAIQRHVADTARPARVTMHQWHHVQSLYRTASYAPLWTGDAGLLPRAKPLMLALAHADDDGLSVAVYNLAALDSAAARAAGPKAVPAPGAAEADVLLTSAFVAYGEGMLRGQVDPRQVQPAWHIAVADLDIDTALVRVLRAPDFGAALAHLRPEQPAYAALRQALGRYRQIAAGGGWPQLPGGRALQRGDTAPEVPTLRRRLAAEGFLPPAEVTESPVYDAALAGAVAAFQARHGLAVDSTVGAGTRATMNVTADRRVAQIAANLERHRWLPHSLGGRYVLVNIPAFHLEAYDEGQPVLGMNVVVGREYGGHATPIFSDSMSYVIFDPYWNVPASIARREILPKAYRDPSYLARNRFEVVKGSAPVTVIPLSSLSRSELEPASFRYRLRQKPGPKNALGRVKFIFPNDYNVYLHDTPEDQLFSERVRAFSHGCIRVEQPAQLAAFILGPQGWTAPQATAAMNAGTWRRVNLKRKLPVYIAYFTAFERDGQLAFRPDVYNQDARLVRALGSIGVSPGAAPIADHVEPPGGRGMAMAKETFR